MKRYNVVYFFLGVFMEAIIVFIVIVLLVFLFKKKSRDKQVSVTMLNADYDDVDVSKQKDDYGTSLTIDFDSTIQKGYQILFKMRNIVLSYNLDNARDCVKSGDYTLVLLREPENENDSNAVAIYSNSGKLGYIPREIAPMLHDGELLSKVVLRIVNMWIGEKKGSMELQILAPKEIVKKLKSN